MRPLEIEFLRRALAYDGTQIGPLWAYREFGRQGDSLVAFVGKCAIPAKHMIDQDDVRRGARIASPRMLHFIAEHFDTPPDLEKAVLRQRLFSTLVLEELRARGAEGLRREGDDLFRLRGEAEHLHRDGDARLDQVPLRNQRDPRARRRREDRGAPRPGN